MTNPTTLIGEQLIEHIFPSPLLGAFPKKKEWPLLQVKMPHKFISFSFRKTNKKLNSTQVFILGKALGFTLHKTQP
jgi:hypothetical protein